jgi:hypothetical protein
VRNFVAAKPYAERLHDPFVLGETPDTTSRMHAAGDYGSVAPRLCQELVG